MITVDYISLTRMIGEADVDVLPEERRDAGVTPPARAKVPASGRTIRRLHFASRIIGEAGVTPPAQAKALASGRTIRRLHFASRMIG